MGAGALEDGAEPLGFGEEAGLAVEEGVGDGRGSADREQREPKGSGAHGGAGVSEHRVDADGAEPGAFACHVGAADDVEGSGRGQRDVVADSGAGQKRMSQRASLEDGGTGFGEEEFGKDVAGMLEGVAGDSIEGFEFGPGIEPGFEIGLVGGTPAVDGEDELGAGGDQQGEKGEELFVALVEEREEALKSADLLRSCGRAYALDEGNEFGRGEILFRQQRQAGLEDGEFAGEGSEEADAPADAGEQRRAQGELKEGQSDKDREKGLPREDLRNAGGEEQEQNGGVEAEGCGGEGMSADERRAEPIAEGVRIALLKLIFAEEGNLFAEREIGAKLADGLLTREDFAGGSGIEEICGEAGGSGLGAGGAEEREKRARAENPEVGLIKVAVAGEFLAGGFEGSPVAAEAVETAFVEIATQGQFAGARVEAQRFAEGSESGEQGHSGERQESGMGCLQGEQGGSGEADGERGMRPAPALLQGEQCGAECGEAACIGFFDRREDGFSFACDVHDVPRVPGGPGIAQRRWGRAAISPP